MIRTEIEVLSADEPKQLKLGWTVMEKIGVAIVNPRGFHTIRKVKTNEQVIIDSNDNLVSN